MPDPRFFKRVGPFTTVAHLSEISGAAVAEGHPSDKLVNDVAPLQSAGADDVSFLDNPLYLSALSASSAAVCVIHPERIEHAPSTMTLLLSENPYLAYAQIAAVFYPEARPVGSDEDNSFIHPTALIGQDTHVSPGAVIGSGAEIGAQCEIGPNAVIGPGVVIGDGCKIGPSVSVRYSIIGSDVRIFAGARIGEAGFGFATGSDGHFTVPQLGRVLVGDKTEIGANTTIDRGSAADTVIFRQHAAGRLCRCWRPSRIYRAFENRTRCSNSCAVGCYE